IAVLGGIDIFGGRGYLSGVLLAVLLPTATVLFAQSIWPVEVAGLLWLLQALLIGALASRCYGWYLDRHAWVKVAQEGEP
ncbi:MAG: hypothetical protein K2W93_00650, partial [Burkholderiaceae bacterium]|nr:hypothetical protein [Burkholderiaceae bacterium]